jgi:hypothetical protein
METAFVRPFGLSTPVVRRSESFARGVSKIVALRHTCAAGFQLILPFPDFVG